MSLLGFLKKHENSSKSGTSKKASLSGDKLQPSAARRNNTQEQVKKIIAITDTYVLSRNVEITQKPEPVSIEFLCPLRPSKIFCHSVLIDKLGEMTKFIIQSLYKGKTIDDIQALTCLGDTAFDEEVAFLVRGGLLYSKENGKLTPLGNQYGQLLEKFDELSSGIPVFLNTFSDQFEESPVELADLSDSNHIFLREEFSLILTRNEKYANSMDIAKSYISSDVPFSSEIQDSLYTTVWVEKDAAHQFKKVVLTDFRYGKGQNSSGSVAIRIPIDRVTLSPRFKSLTPYRNTLEHLIALYEDTPAMLTTEAARIASMAQEETKAKEIVIDVNAITGDISRYIEDFSTDDNPSALTIDAPPVLVRLSENVSDNIILVEANRVRYYKMLFFPYTSMEAT